MLCGLHVCRALFSGVINCLRRSERARDRDINVKRLSVICYIVNTRIEKNYIEKYVSNENQKISWHSNLKHK